MTDRERMELGLLYDPGDEELMTEQMSCQDKLREFNALLPSRYEEQQRYMKEMFAECGENNFLQRPVYANWGCRHVHLGSNIYANFNLTLVDDGHIYIGDWTKFGPNVTVATPGHPIMPELREGHVLQYNKDVHIGRRVWIGAGTVICPGVTIGDDTVIGAGSVVTRDIPSGVVAYGNPCRVIRSVDTHIGDPDVDSDVYPDVYPDGTADEGENSRSDSNAVGRDREFFFKNERIDWDELTKKYGAES
ncbi:MAG: sugar O-acetyltransferase [Mogibacterium sp.]|nr:sugar O-acetyltransferase [Mogibacterium sp.]